MKIIFDNDAAIDDIIALIYLLSHPDVTIEAITIAGTGEAHGSFGAVNMANLCCMLDFLDIPIAYGNAAPYSQTGKPFPDFLRQKMDDVFAGKEMPVHPDPKISNSAVDLIRKTLEQCDEKATILATGPLTNIAECIVRYPHLRDKIERIVIMGGAIHAKGNIQVLDPASDNEVAEWNIYADPEAANIVFSSQIPVTLVPLDVTAKVPMTQTFYDELSHQLQPGLKLIYQLLKDAVDSYGMENFLESFYLWDPLAAMICVNPQIAMIQSMPVVMDVENAQTRLADSGDSSMIQVAFDIPDAHLVLQRLLIEMKSNLINLFPKPSPASIFYLPEIVTGVPGVAAAHQQPSLGGQC